jgi:hypothetical protein
MSVHLSWEGGQRPPALLLPPAEAPEPLPLPPGAVRVTVSPQPAVPSKVIAFFDFDGEDFIPPWRLESDQDRRARIYLEARGCWTG